MRRRRPALPGVTAAATTAVFATGEGPGETALATTAVFATGWPMTPTLPTRAALSGISVSSGRSCVIRLDGRDDRLNGNPSVRDQPTTRATRRRCERRRPQVLPDQDAGSAPRLHGGSEVQDIVRGQQFGQLGFDLRDQFLGHLAAEVARSGRKLDDDVIDGTELVQGYVDPSSLQVVRQFCFCHERSSVLCSLRNPSLTS